jgi:hypothetical protein
VAGSLRSIWALGGALAFAAACSSSEGSGASGNGVTGSGGGYSATGGAGTTGGSTAGSTCGDGVRQNAEACDGSDFGGQTCASFTLDAQPNGSLRCSACTIDASLCVGTNGGSGGGGSPSGAGGMSSGGTTGSSGGTSGASGGTTGSSGGTSGGDQETGRMVGMTAAMNAVRHGVSTSNPLPDLTWSSQIASVAQAYADKLASQGCQMVHSNNPNYGENLAWFSGSSPTAAYVANAWAGESACYTYGPFESGDACTAACSGGCGHYTQIVWRDTTEVGCGMASCPGSEVWVCNFAPPGNYVGETPY